MENQLIDQLTTQIHHLKPIKTQLQHQSKYKNQILKTYLQESKLLDQNSQKNILQSYQQESLQNLLYVNKIKIKGQLNTLQNQLQIYLLQKQQLLRKCQNHQQKITGLKQSNNEAICKKQKMSHERAKISYEIKSQQLKNDQIHTKNTELRQKCQRFICQISELTVNNNNQKSNQKLVNFINQNINIVVALNQKSSLHQHFMKKQYKYVTERPILLKNIKELAFTLKDQEYKKKVVLQKLKQQQKIHQQLLKDEQKLTKKSQVLTTITKSNHQQISNLNTQLLSLETNSQDLDDKLKKYQAIKIDMENTYQQLLLKFKSCKEKDLMQVKSMTRKLQIDQKNRELKQYVLKQRDNILNKYKKYLAYTNE